MARFFELGDNLMETMVGTPLTMDPLILFKQKYSEKCDIWSLGVIFYQMVTGRYPFNPGAGGTLEDLKKLVQNPVAFPGNIELSSCFKDMIRKMLVIDPIARMSFD